MSDQRPTCTAVILPPREMSFHRVAGLPVIQRAALSALRSGFDAVVALAPGDGRPVRALFAGDPRTAVIPVVAGALDASVATEHVALIPSHCVVDTPTIEQVRAVECNGRPIVLRSDGGGSALVLAPRSYLADVDGLDTVDARRGRTPTASCTGVRRRLGAARRARWCQRRLARNGGDRRPIARFDRTVSTRISRYLVRTLRPNHINAIGTTIGFLGAGSGHGTYLSGSDPARCSSGWR
jgi:hypothetical protein